jgi:hypothetical protein
MHSNTHENALSALQCPLQCIAMFPMPIAMPNTLFLKRSTPF